MTQKTSVEISSSLGNLTVQKPAVAEIFHYGEGHT